MVGEADENVWNASAPAFSNRFTVLLKILLSQGDIVDVILRVLGIDWSALLPF